MRIQWARTFAKATLRTGTRLLHPWRRQVAREVLERGAPFDSVLFICLGNVCRSPYAEAAARQRTATGESAPPSIDSAGFIGPGRGVPETALAVGAEREIDLAGHVSKVLTPELAAAHALILVMEPGQVASTRALAPSHPAVLVLGDLDPERQGRRTIADPWGKDADEFRASFDRIDRCLAEVLPYLGNGVVRRSASASKP